MLSTPFKVDRVVSWAPIRDVVLKFNVDGAARDKSGPVGIGGALHISGCEVLVLFSKPVGCMESNEVEVMAINTLFLLLLFYPS